MKSFPMTIISVLILIGAVGLVRLGELLAATTLTDSKVESIDSTGLTITVQTARDGDKLSIPVVSPEVVAGVTAGEQVSLELDVQGRVVKILKLAPAPQDEEAPDPGA